MGDGIVPDKSVKLHSDKVEHSAFVYDEVETKTITKEKNKVPHGLDEETGVYTADNYKNDTRPHTLIAYNKKDEYDREDAPYNKADGRNQGIAGENIKEKTKRAIHKEKNKAEVTNP